MGQEGNKISFYLLSADVLGRITDNHLWVWQTVSFRPVWMKPLKYYPLTSARPSHQILVTECNRLTQIWNWFIIQHIFDFHRKNCWLFSNSIMVPWWSPSIRLPSCQNCQYLIFLIFSSLSSLNRQDLKNLEIEVLSRLKLRLKPSVEHIS